MFSKFVYMSSMSSYYTFYLIHKFGLELRQAQMLLFVFLGAVAVGTLTGASAFSATQNSASTPVSALSAPLHRLKTVRLGRNAAA
jgi:outer membrane murein-binding lipoprotein Lpp